MSKFSSNRFYTRDLVLNVMENVARRLGLDIDDDETANEIYWVCSDLEDYPEDCGFGSSDGWCYVQRAREVFNMPEDMPEAA